MEIWKTISDYPKYEISNLGNIRNIKKNTLLKIKINSKGYLCSNIYISDIRKKRKIELHRLIAKEFIENPENKPEVDHINRNKLDNSISNLRWVTRSENMRNLSTYNGYKRKLTNSDVIKIKNLLSLKTISQSSIAKMFNVHYTHINNIYKGRVRKNISNELFAE